jgi:hypothetical protein
VITIRKQTAKLERARLVIGRVSAPLLEAVIEHVETDPGSPSA